MKNYASIVAQIRTLIQKDDLVAAIKALSDLLQGSSHLNEVLLQSASYQDISRQIHLGTVDSQTANMTKNKIRLALLELLQMLEAENQDSFSQTQKSPTEKQTIKDNKTIIQNAEKIYNIEHIDNANFS